MLCKLYGRFQIARCICSWNLSIFSESGISKDLNTFVLRIQWRYVVLDYILRYVILSILNLHLFLLIDVFKRNKKKRNLKWKITHTVLERQTLCFSSYKNHKLKVKLWLNGARKRKKGHFFVPFILPKGYFFNICVLSQWIVYWIQFQIIFTFTYQKTLLHTLLLLVFKIIKSFQCILNH